MKITWKHGGRSVEFEHQPMPPERFTALCKLAGPLSAAWSFGPSAHDWSDGHCPGGGGAAASGALQNYPKIR